jgi:hypothetical protein
MCAAILGGFGSLNGRGLPGWGKVGVLCVLLNSFPLDFSSAPSVPPYCAVPRYLSSVVHMRLLLHEEKKLTETLLLPTVP